MNSMSLATSARRRGLPRELSSSTRTLLPARTSAFTRPEPMKPLPPVTRMRALLTKRFPRAVFGGKIDPRALAVRAPRGVHQLLHAIALGKSGRRGAAAFDGVEKSLGQPRHRRNAAVGILRVVRIADGDALERRRRPLGVKQFEAAHIVGARILQHQRAVLAEEFDAVAGAEIGRAAHGQARQRARLELQRHRYRRFQVAFVRQSADARRQSGDRPAEPLEIMETVADEIAQHAAAVVAHGFPIAHAQLQRAAFHVPMHRDMAQRADRRRHRASLWRAARLMI